MTGHKKYIQFSGNMVQSPLFVHVYCIHLVEVPMRDLHTVSLV